MAVVDVMQWLRLAGLGASSVLVLACTGPKRDYGGEAGSVASSEGGSSGAAEMGGAGTSGASEIGGAGTSGASEIGGAGASGASEIGGAGTGGAAGMTSAGTGTSGAAGTAGAGGTTPGGGGHAGTSGASGGTTGQAGAGGGCVSNLACTTNPNPCKSGVTSCTMGSLVCLDGANAAAGKACGSAPVTSCSGADTCDGAGACSPNNLAAGTDCGVCQQCNGSGTCLAGYQGAADPTGCNAPQSCSGTTKTLAQTCSSGQCVATTSTCATGCTGNDCTAPRCGDNVVQSSEQCDDGNTVTETCAYGLMSCMVCNSSCQKVNGAVSYCGDRVTQTAAGEMCDDGNTSNLDLCSTTCKTCGLDVGPALPNENDEHGDSGLQFATTANATLVQFVVHNQGKPSTIVLRAVTATAVQNRPILQQVQIPANLDANMNTVPQNVTLTVSWPLTAGTTYTISDLAASNGLFAVVSGKFPDNTLPGVQIQGAWDAGDPDFGIPESVNDSYWYTFTGLRTCLR